MTTPADTLTTAQMAGVVLTDNPTVGISAAFYSAVSADATIASIVDAGGNTVGVAGQSVGDTLITVTRLSDGATGTLTAHITGLPGGTFGVTLGGAAPK